MAEALAEAIYLLRCPSVLGELSAIRGQCLLVALSEPSRCAIPWPFPEEAKQARSVCCLPHATLAASSARTCCLCSRVSYCMYCLCEVGQLCCEGAQGAGRQCIADSARHGQGVAGFEDLLKAFGRHGGALSVLSWRRQGMQANQAHRFIAMYAIAQVRGLAVMQPCILGHQVPQVCHKLC